MIVYEHTHIHTYVCVEFGGMVTHTRMLSDSTGDRIGGGRPVGQKTLEPPVRMVYVS